MDKDHPACPLCGGATNKVKLSPNAYQGEDVLDLELKRHELSAGRGKVHVCKNCGAKVDEDGKLFNSKGSEINMFGDTQDYG